MEESQVQGEKERIWIYTWVHSLSLIPITAEGLNKSFNVSDFQISNL